MWSSLHGCKRICQGLIVMVHKVIVNAPAKSMHQKHRPFTPMRNRSSNRLKVDKLLYVGFMWEMYYIEWLADVVRVERLNGK